MLQMHWGVPCTVGFIPTSKNLAACGAALCVQNIEQAKACTLALHAGLGPSRIIRVVEIAVEISQQPDWVLCLDAWMKPVRSCVPFVHPLVTTVTIIICLWAYHNLQILCKKSWKISSVNFKKLMLILKISQTGSPIALLECNNFTINPIKCDYGIKETDWLLLSAHAKRFKKKIDTILALQQPQTVKQLHSFLGV
jgi:hypothetical protein